MLCKNTQFVVWNDLQFKTNFTEQSTFGNVLRNELVRMCSSVSIATWLPLGQPASRDLILDRDKRFFSSPQHPDRLCGSPISLFVLQRVFFLIVRPRFNERFFSTVRLETALPDKYALVWSFASCMFCLRAMFQYCSCTLRQLRWCGDLTRAPHYVMLHVGGTRDH